MTSVAVCTGGASGIGRATAVALGRRGASVMVGDVDEAGGEETTGLVREAGGEAEFLRADIAEPGEVEALVSAAVERFGRLDAAANVAGTHAGLGALTAEVTEDDFDTQIRVNLRGTWLCVRAELGHMVSQGSGSIVNVSSVNGLTARGARGRLLDCQARDPGAHPHRGGRVRGARHPGERDLPRPRGHPAD